MITVLQSIKCTKTQSKAIFHSTKENFRHKFASLRMFFLTFHKSLFYGKVTTLTKVKLLLIVDK